MDHLIARDRLVGHSHCIPWNLPQLLRKEYDVIRALLISSKKIGEVTLVALNACYLAVILPIHRKLFFGMSLAKIIKKNWFAV